MAKPSLAGRLGRRLAAMEDGTRRSRRATAVLLGRHRSVTRAAMSEAIDLTSRATFPLWVQETARYGDTDRQGHVNNAVFATFCETGRVSFLYDRGTPLAPRGCSFVIARLVLDFRAEIQWQDVVDIGTVVQRIGRSSFSLGQGLFVGATCVATSEGVIVLIDNATRRSTPFPDALRARLAEFQGSPAPAG